MESVNGFPPPPPGNSNSMAIQAASTILVILVVVLLLTCYLLVYFRHAFALACFGVGPMMGGPHRHQERSRGLSRALIDSFPTYLYSDVKAHRLGNAELECAVCLSEFNDHEILRLLPSCSHVFHPYCIDTWLLSRATCPLCRSNVGSCNGHTYSQHMMRTNHDIVSEDDNISIDLTSNVTETTTPIGRPRNDVVPKSHSTGHSPAWILHDTERFTLRLPDDQRTTLAMTWDPSNRSTTLPLRSSPRCWYRVQSGVGWGNRVKTMMEYSNRFNMRNILDRLGKTDTRFVSRSHSLRSDGPVDYSSLVANGNTFA